jgi:hypothetical protein
VFSFPFLRMYEYDPADFTHRCATTVFDGFFSL